MCGYSIKSVILIFVWRTDHDELKVEAMKPVKRLACERWWWHSHN